MNEKVEYIAPIKNFIMCYKFRKRVSKLYNGVRWDRMSAYMEEANELIAQSVKKLIDSAVETVAARLPNDNDKDAFLARIEVLECHGIEAAIQGQDYKKYIKRGAYETSVWLANHYADTMLNHVAGKFPEGKARNEIVAALRELAHAGIEGLCSGTSVEQIKITLEKCAKEKMQNYVAENSSKWSENAGKSIYKVLKTSGNGSRKINRYIKNGTNMFAAELSTQLVVNFSEVLSGGKRFGDAVFDTAIYTAKNTGKKYVQSQGAEIVADACKELAKRAEKEIANKTLREAATKGLGKLADANAVIQTAGAIYEVGKALNQLLDGEITKSEFLFVIGEKGTAFVVSSVFTVVGAGLGGPVGAAIGGAIGSAISYFTTGFIYGSLMQAFSKAEMARQRYEQIHMYCEYAIAKLERERQEFLNVTTALFANREKVIKTNLTRYEAALKNNNVGEINEAFKNISNEFGFEYKAVTRGEVKRLITDKNAVLEL